MVVTVKLSKGSLPASSDTLHVRIKTAIDSSAFPLAKLHPERNNLRSASVKTDEATLLPTPHYNSSVLEV